MCKFLSFSGILYIKTTILTRLIVYLVLHFDYYLIYFALVPSIHRVYYIIDRVFAVEWARARQPVRNA